MRPTFIAAAAAGAALAATPSAVAAEAAPTAAPTTEIVVLGSQLRNVELSGVASSVTVLDAQTIDAASHQHFQELTALVPNLNLSGEGSRARYYQIRGTGELEQYEGAPNPSVGFIIDDIDLSDIGGVATTYDLQTIEVLRGPQGTRYGANALAGLIYIRSAAPTPTPEGGIQLTAGSDETAGLGGFASGPVPGTGDELLYRIAVHNYGSDGFRHNDYLGRDDTARRDEFTARGKLRWQPADEFNAELTGLVVDLDNGYDDFAIENGYTTHSDDPGRDTQHTNAGALRLNLGPGEWAELISITTYAKSDIGYGFDADWGNPEYWAPYVYSFVQDFDRQRTTWSQELRLVSAPGTAVEWVGGLYLLNLSESNQRYDQGFCAADTCGEEIALDQTTSSRYRASNLAAYGEVRLPVATATQLALGLRWEQRRASYADSADARFSPTDRMLGGDVALIRELGSATTGWLKVARGYKAGGFNPSLAGIDFDEFPDLVVEPGQVEFEPEYLWNYEAGIRLAPLASRWNLAASVFYQDREDLQIKVPVQLRLGDPTTFVFFTDNADSGRTYGLELEGTWQPVDPLTLGVALGLLDTEIQEFDTRPELEGRELAHAPRYTFALYASWQNADGWFFRADYTGKDEFAIDYCQSPDCNDPRTPAYQLLDLRAGRRWDGVTVELWLKNALDEEYVTRGFYFGNEPPDFAPTFYTRLGDPRRAGLTVSYAFP